MKNNHMKIESFKKKETKEPKGVTVTSKNIGKMMKKAKVALEDNHKRNMNQPPVGINLPKKVIPVKSETNQEHVDKRKTLPQLFKKGQSGNPNGRPKGILSWRNTIKEAAMKEIELMEKSTGKKITKTLNQIIAEKLVEKARMGDIQAIKEYGDRTDGKAHQSINLEGDLSITQRLIILPAKKGKE